MARVTGSRGGGGSSTPWSASFTWRMEDFSKLTSELVRSDCFEAGICSWRLKVYPGGCSDGKNTHLSVYLEAQDDMWALNAEVKLTLINQASASESLYAGGVPCDVTLKLACGAELPSFSLLLQLASPFFRNTLEDVKGSAPIPVDGSLGTWTYILSCLYPLHDQPELTPLSVHTLLPVVHKYDFSKLPTRLMGFVKGKSAVLSHNPECSGTYAICWLALAERLQLDELHELCLERLKSMPREQPQSAITVQVAGADKQKKHVLRKQVQQLGHELIAELLTMTAAAITA
ncbi:hypothetical protein FOA52_003619 [Chlamydomonas sp. UWO 241]|nr:hypothetical protein FOA52_003619 [Chlamydomonas sp. UWO 241]